MMACVYRPPDTNYENFNQAVIKAESVIKDYAVLVAGDL